MTYHNLAIRVLVGAFLPQWGTCYNVTQGSCLGEVAILPKSEERFVCG